MINTFSIILRPLALLIIILIAVTALSTKTVFAGTFTCNDGTSEALPNAEDNLTARREVCSDKGGFGSTTAGGPCELSDNFLGIPTWYKYLDKETDSTGKCNVVLSGGDTEEKANSALPIGLALLEATLRLAGLVAVVMVFWGGFKYITSQGNPDSAKGARTTVINAIIGLVIVIVSTSLVTFIGGNIK
jgi:Type IV secretion system pilin